MHRRPLLQLFHHYAASHPGESATVAAFSRFVEEEPQCFARSHPPGHLTGSAWIVNLAGDCVLLTHHAKLNIWVQLGGHADGHPDLFEVALREALEESGLPSLSPVAPEIFDLDIHPIPARPGEPAHLHYDVRFAFQHTGSSTVIPTHESRALAWVPLPQLPSYSQEASLMRMRTKWLARSPS